MKRLNVELPDGLHRELKLSAMYQGLTMSALVNELVSIHLERFRADSIKPRRRSSDWLIQGAHVSESRFSSDLLDVS